MAFDFPSAPVIGQTYTSGGVTYKWDGQAWNGGPVADPGTKVATGTVPPSNPVPGDLWWESDTGNFFLYYNDGNTSQWVQFNYAPALDQFYVKADTDARARLAAQKNILYNSDFSFSQQGLYAALATNNVYFADGWITSFAGTGFAVTAQATSAVSGLLQKGRLRGQMKCTTAKGSLAVGDVWQVYHPIEGVDILPLKWGTANAIGAVLRFGFKGPAGTYGVSMINQPSVTHSWVGIFTVSALEANTDKIVTLAIPANSALGTWGNSTTIGASLRFCLASGTTYQGAAGWQAGNYVSTSAQFNGLGTVGNTFEIFDVNLIPDPDGLGDAFDPGYPVPDYGTELARCERYYQPGVNVQWTAYNAAAAISRFTMQFRTKMRTTPAATLITTGSLTNCSAPTLAPLNASSAYFQHTTTALGNATSSGYIYDLDAQM